MSRRIRLWFVVFLAFCALAVAEKQETWLEVCSPHFIVVTNSSEKQGRRIADQFERMRSVFHVAFPKLQIDPSAPIIVLAIKDEKDFRALEPEAYLAKGSLKLGGLFLPAPDKNFVLMRLDAQGEHPYSVIYHEYTHLLTRKAEWMPLWMNEGLAEYYENTDIQENSVSLGQASPQDIAWLRQNQLLPLPTLFAVDHNSPFYHEEKKGTIFYAESWALMHYLITNDRLQKTTRVADYANLLAQNVDSVTAATKAFGDLNQLRSALDEYIRGDRFHYIKMEVSTGVDESSLKVQPLTPSEADALRADFLAYNQRFSDAQSIVDRVLKADPTNVSAHETKGFLEFHQGHASEAKYWYKQAVQLDSNSYLAHYNFASIAMMDAKSGDDEAQIESSLRTAIKLNPSFGPAFDRLAAFLGMHHKSLDEARMMGLNAVTLEPSNVGYRVNVANIYLEMEQGKNAVNVLETAAKLAKTSEDVRFVESALARAREYANAQERYAEQKKEYERSTERSGPVIAVTGAGVPKLKRRDFVPHGPHLFLVGVLKNVHCDTPSIELIVTSKGEDVAMFADNYFNLPFTAVGFKPSGDLNPCGDLENRPAKVEYVKSANPGVSAQLISVELHK